MITHGTRSAYVQGCRCRDCLQAERAYHRTYYQHWKNTEGGKAWREKGAQRRQERRRATAKS